MKKVFLPVLLAAMFSVAAVEPRPVKVVLFPFREAEIAAKVDGTVKEYKFRVGERFKAGEVLVLLDDTRYRIDCERAEASAQDAKIQAEFADESYVSQKKLFDENFQSKIELKRREAESASANARKKIADANYLEAKLLLGYCFLNVPFDGKIEEVLCREHETVRAGQPLFKVIDDGKLLAVMNVPVSAPRTIGTELSFRFAGHPDVVKGKVLEVSPRADHRSGTIEIKALIDNSDGKLTAGLTGVLTDGE